MERLIDPYRYWPGANALNNSRAVASAAGTSTAVAVSSTRGPAVASAAGTSTAAAVNGTAGPPVCIADEYYSCGPTNDPYWANVVLLLKYDEGSGTQITDSSSYADHKTAGAGQVVQATTSKFGGGALKLTQREPVSALWTGTKLARAINQSFTIEGWFRKVSTVNSTATPIIFRWQTSGAIFVQLLQYSTGNTVEVRFGTGDSGTQHTYTPGPDGWVHFAVVSNADAAVFYLNGVAARSLTFGSELAGTPSLYVGGYINSDANAIEFYLDDFRFTNGAARYISDFTPPGELPVETDWSPADPRTVLLVHGDEDPLEDLSCYQTKTIALTNNIPPGATLSDEEVRFGAKAIKIVNEGGSTVRGVQLTDHADFDFGTGDFTLELNAYRSANTYVGTLFYCASLGGSVFNFTVGTDGLIDITYRSSGGTQTRSNVATFPVTTWQHVVIQRKGLNWETYLEGVLIDSVAITGGASSTVDSAADWFFGRTNASSAQTWNGYIDEIRVTKGAARYANPNLPTAAFPDGVEDPYWANVVLMLHGETLLDSSPSAHAIASQSGVTASSTQAKFGASSIKASTTSSYINFGPSSDFGRSLVFTLEFWIYLTSEPSSNAYFLSRDAVSHIYFNSVSKTIIFTAWGNSAATLDTTVPVGAWTHLALSSDGVTQWLFKNGALVTSVVAGTTTSSSASLGVVSGGPDASWLRSFPEAYLDEVRYTQGICRYPANFTPPALPFCESTVGAPATQAVGTAAGTSTAYAVGAVVPPDPPTEPPVSTAFTSIVSRGFQVSDSYWGYRTWVELLTNGVVKEWLDDTFQAWQAEMNPARQWGYPTTPDGGSDYEWTLLDGIAAAVSPTPPGTGLYTPVSSDITVVQPTSGITFSDPTQTVWTGLVAKIGIREIANTSNAIEITVNGYYQRNVVIPGLR